MVLLPPLPPATQAPSSLPEPQHRDPLQHPATGQRVKQEEKERNLHSQKALGLWVLTSCITQGTGTNRFIYSFLCVVINHHFNAYYYREWQYHMYHITIALSLNIQLSNFSTTWRKYFFHIVVSLGYLQETFLFFFFLFVVRKLILSNPSSFQFELSCWNYDKSLQN